MQCFLFLRIWPADPLWVGFMSGVFFFVPDGFNQLNLILSLVSKGNLGRLGWAPPLRFARSWSQDSLVWYNCSHAWAMFLWFDSSLISCWRYFQDGSLLQFTAHAKSLLEVVSFVKNFAGPPWCVSLSFSVLPRLVAACEVLGWAPAVLVPRCPCTHGDPAVDAVTGRRCRLALLCLLVCERREVLILCLPSDFYRVGATAGIHCPCGIWHLWPRAKTCCSFLKKKKFFCCMFITSARVLGLLEPAALFQITICCRLTWTLDVFLNICHYLVFNLTLKKRGCCHFSGVAVLGRDFSMHAYAGSIWQLFV